MPDYLLSSAESDCERVTHFSRQLSLVEEAPTTITVGVREGDPAEGYAQTPAGSPGSDAWDSSDHVASVEVIAPNSFVWLSIRLDRVGHDCTIKESGPASAEQNLTASARYEFQISAPQWGSTGGAVEITDRLRYTYIFRQTGDKVKPVDIGTGRLDSRHISPIERRILTRVPLALVPIITKARSAFTAPYDPTVSGVSLEPDVVHLEKLSYGIGIKGVFGIPYDYDSVPQVIVVWSAPSTFGAAIFELGVRFTSGSGIADLSDFATDETVQLIARAPASPEQRLETRIPISVALDGADDVVFTLKRRPDLDTIGTKITVHSLYFAYLAERNPNLLDNSVLGQGSTLERSMLLMGG